MPLTTPTLAITDNANETVTITLSGVTSGATNVVSRQSVNGELGTAAWTTVSTTQDTTSIAGVSVDAGFYWWKCQTSLSGEAVVSNLVYQNVTDGVSAVMERCLTATQTRIQGLSLVSNSSVVIHKQPRVTNLTLPAIVIGIGGPETMDVRQGTNTRDDVGYPVFVGIVAADNQNQTSNRGTWLKWREKIARAFRNQRLTGVSEIVRCEVQTSDIVDPSWFDQGRFISKMVLRFISREVRGI